MRERWTRALRSRIAGSGGPYGLLDPGALTEAVELFAATTETYDIVETCHLAGMLHWHRATALADERSLPEIRTAMALLVLVSRAGTGLPLPDQVPVFPAHLMIRGGEPAWEDLLEALGLRLEEGTDAHTARLAVAAGRNAVADALGDPARLSGRLRVLGIAWQRLFEQTGETAALEQAVSVARSAAAHAPPESGDRTMALHNLADALRVLSGRTGGIDHLREAVTIGREVVAHQDRAVAGDKRYLALTGHADSLRMLYERTDDAAVLDEALTVSAAALESVAEHEEPPAAVLVNSSILLRCAFESTGDTAVLHEALTMARRAARSALPGTPGRQISQYNLGSLLQVLAARTGDLDALDEAIENVRAVVHDTPPGHPDGPLYRSALVGQLHERFVRAGDAEALDEAVDLGRQAVEATRGDHPERWMHLANLAVCLKARAELTDDLGALRLAIGTGRRAAEAAVGTGRHGAAALSNLGNALRLLHHRTGDTAALEEAVSVCRAAVAGTGEDHAHRSQCEFNLAMVLSEHGPRTGDAGPVEEAVRLLETAASRSTAPTGVRVSAAREWGALAARRGDHEDAARGLALGVGLLPRLAARGLPRADAARWMAEYGRLAGDAAACALAVGRPEQAVELLEVGRGVLLAQVLESRTDLTELRERAPHLASGFDRLCARLDGDGSPDAVLDIAAGTPAEDDPDRRRALARELDALVADIRALPGLERFLLPPRAAALTAEACDGPVAVVNVSHHRCDALIVTAEGVQVCELPRLDLDEIHSRLGALQSLLGGIGGLDATGRREAEHGLAAGTLPWLWDTVTGPVLDRIGFTGPLDEDAARRLWWVPCGPLAHFPLHAAGHHLEAPAEGAPRRTVMDRAVSSYTPTVRALAHARSLRAAQRAAAGESRGPLRVLAIAMPHTPGAAELPGAEREYGHLARLLPAVDELVARDATRASVLSGLPTHPWVHFACHAGTDPADPYRSHLLVHDHARHPLTVLDISRLRLESSEFAYLSACSTAATAPELADESIHVATAFQLAGFPNVVGTLWQVDDRIAAGIAERIYTGLAADGFDSARAGECVHRATRLMRDRYPRFPTLWSAHLHMGV
ncbi:CHAT domain-containing protein [Streptomyces sp. NPDC001787]|uniref:CHAT domain-containing protein n=1 Tax=Streptomyces sp. NPDC001787 TaxID=3154523 RepID=UPI0033282B6D